MKYDRRVQILPEKLAYEIMLILTNLVIDGTIDLYTLWGFMLRSVELKSE